MDNLSNSFKTAIADFLTTNKFDPKLDFIVESRTQFFKITHKKFGVFFKVYQTYDSFDVSYSRFEHPDDELHSGTSFNNIGAVIRLFTIWVSAEIIHALNESKIPDPFAKTDGNDGTILGENTPLSSEERHKFISFIDKVILIVEEEPTISSSDKPSLVQEAEEIKNVSNKLGRKRLGELTRAFLGKIAAKVAIDKAIEFGKFLYQLFLDQLNAGNGGFDPPNLNA